MAKRGRFTPTGINFSSPWEVLLFYLLAERGRFELPVSCPTHPFQGCALGHYATSPESDSANSIENSEKSKEK